MPAPHNRPMMKCGHAANGTHRPDHTDPDGTTHPVAGTRPCCVICAPSKEAYEIDPSPPDLRTREARCPSCDARRPSSPTLPFFEYRGPGSLWDTDVHPQDKNPMYHKPGGCDFDSFYCGCRGWG